MIGLEQYRAIGSPSLTESDTQLRAYGGQKIPVKGKCLVTVTVGENTFDDLPLLVINRERCSNLLGLPWADKFGLTEFGLSTFSKKEESCHETSSLNTLPPMETSEANYSLAKLEDLKNKYPTVFDTNSLGHCSMTTANLQLKKDVRPIFKRSSQTFAFYTENGV